MLEWLVFLAVVLIGAAVGFALGRGQSLVDALAAQLEGT